MTGRDEAGGEAGGEATGETRRDDVAAPLARWLLWADSPRALEHVLRGLYVLCALLVAVELVWHRHTYVPGEELFGYHAIVGFFAFLLIVLGAKQLRRLIRRDEGYYGAASIDAERYPEPGLARRDAEEAGLLRVREGRIVGPARSGEASGEGAGRGVGRGAPRRRSAADGASGGASGKAPSARTSAGGASAGRISAKKKASAKKTSSKKSTAKKAVAKKAVAKKAAAKKASSKRSSSRKRGGRKGGSGGKRS